MYYVLREIQAVRYYLSYVPSEKQSFSYDMHYVTR